MNKAVESGLRVALRDRIHRHAVVRHYLAMHRQINSRSGIIGILPVLTAFKRLSHVLTAPYKPVRLGARSNQLTS